MSLARGDPWLEVERSRSLVRLSPVPSLISLLPPRPAQGMVFTMVIGRSNKPLDKLKESPSGQCEYGCRIVLFVDHRRGHYRECADLLRNLECSRDTPVLPKEVSARLFLDR